MTEQSPKRYRPKKYLGQNFLTDGRVQQKIVQSCDLRPTDVVVEIGPGQGALTHLIAPLVCQLICVEADKDLIEPLSSVIVGGQEERSNLSIIHADFLKWDMPSLSGPVKVIANIPYYISTPIIEKLIEQRQKISSAFLTVQLEFGQRLAALPGGKDYGSLSCFMQYYADIELLFKIKNTCFRPSPKVDSCFLRLDIKTKPDLAAADEKFLFKLIQTAFNQRRKTIVNALKAMTGKERLEEVLAGLGLNFNARPENLTLANYIQICNKMLG